MDKIKFNPLLLVGIGLISFALFGSRLAPVIEISETKFPPPANQQLVDLCKPVSAALKGSGNDAVRLGNLLNDIATLIEIDNDIIKNTEEIREANRIAGKMSELNMKDKYPDLAEAANKAVVEYIGDDNFALSPELRQKSVEVFRALAWACQESK